MGENAFLVSPRVAKLARNFLRCDFNSLRVSIRPAVRASENASLNTGTLAQRIFLIKCIYRRIKDIGLPSLRLFFSLPRAKYPSKGNDVRVRRVNIKWKNRADGLRGAACN
jgi:hypothetical protein